MLYPDNGVAVAPSMRVLMFAAASLLYFIYNDEPSGTMKGLSFLRCVITQPSLTFIQPFICAVLAHRRPLFSACFLSLFLPFPFPSGVTFWARTATKDRGTFINDVQIECESFADHESCLVQV